MFGGAAAGEDADGAAQESGRMSSFQSVENDSEDKYFRKYQAILRRCKSIQKENEMLVNRVYQVKKIVRRLRRERKFLMEELDKRGDNYRSLPLTIAIDEEEKSFALPQVKREKVERDPSAPKRPSSAFLQFCQDQRETTSAQHLQQTGRPVDKKQLTKLLTARWSSLGEDDKKVYIDRFERDKEQYSEERRLYESRKME
ncbi:non-histone protein 10-like isoform X2 [Penaeus chinensis]|uniref:non-histone protein 10-like isoform X2 n=1 Tax=Penaeus chinensis TaxID=139456 RepID=UPI001FB5FEE3|nr:non-histone protein 10-like isoform X2 [Penaeus chinensis]